MTIGAEGGECWFGVYQDKKLVHNAQLKSGETRDYEVPYPFKVSVGNRAKGFVKVDGAPVDLNINNRATSTVFTLVQNNECPLHKEPMIVRWKDNIVEIGAGRP